MRLLLDVLACEGQQHECSERKQDLGELHKHNIRHSTDLARVS